MVLWAKGEKSDLHLLQVQQALDYLFSVTNGEREKKVSLEASAGLSFLGGKGEKIDQHLLLFSLFPYNGALYFPFSW